MATAGGRIVATKGGPDAPVNRGLNCIKGYFNGKILYGAGRLTQPLLRMKDGRFDKKGPFVPVSWQVAMDEMERRFRKAYGEKGPSGVAIIGSGQYTIQEGCVAAKLMKAGFRSNNIDPNARHCMASAVAAFMQTFGIDEPANVYDDIELADTMVPWGANMAEAHPILWSRITDRKLAAKATKVVNLATYRNMSSDLADLEIVMAPSSDLAIQNCIARELVSRNAVNWDFVKKHCVFATGPTDIGYGMRPTSKFALDAEKDTQAKDLEVTLGRAEAIGQRRQPGEKVAHRNDAMKRFLAAFSLALLALAATAQQKPAVVDGSQFSLSKGSVFEAATPAPFEFQDGAKTICPSRRRRTAASAATRRPAGRCAARRPFPLRMWPRATSLPSSASAGTAPPATPRRPA